MAKRTCPFCKKQIHHAATVCPYCTRQVKSVSYWKTTQGALVAFILILFGIGFIGNLAGGKKEEKTPSAAVKTEKKTPAPKKELTAEEKAKAARVKKFGAMPEQSGWDGSYRVVNDYLKQVAKDPDSIEIEGCTAVSYADEGWLIGCDWRAKNSFGGYVRDYNWFVVRNRQVINMKPGTAYSLK